MESLDQAAGGGGGVLAVVCPNCGISNTVKVRRESGTPLNPQLPWVWKCLDYGLTEDEWLAK